MPSQWRKLLVFALGTVLVGCGSAGSNPPAGPSPSAALATPPVVYPTLDPASLVTPSVIYPTPDAASLLTPTPTAYPTPDAASLLTSTPTAYPTPAAATPATPSAGVPPVVSPVAGPTATPNAAAPDQPERQTYRVINTYPHDPAAFTQGLAIDDGVLYEGTGLEGRSTLRKVDLASGEVLQSHDLPPSVFGEGITVFEDRIIQLTWLSRLGYVYDKSSFEMLREWSYPTEGWGITHDGERLIMSDGTSRLHLLDPESLQEIGYIDVTAGGQPIANLNELEYIDGDVYANIWQSDLIARIDPQTGQVEAWIDLSGLLGPEDRQQPVDVLNGIAYDAAADRLFVTGKLWPKLFEIELVDAP